MRQLVHSNASANSRFFYSLDDNGQYWPVDERIFFLAKGLGFGYQEVLNMPVKILRWYVQRLMRQIEEENKALKAAQAKAKAKSRARR